MATSTAPRRAVLEGLVAERSDAHVDVRAATRCRDDRVDERDLRFLAERERERSRRRPRSNTGAAPARARPPEALP
jgi:hypothetical protein